MITYATEFPIDGSNSIADVLRLACEWVSGSPHTKISKTQLDTQPAEGELHLVIENESVTLGAAATGSIEMGGIRYTRIDDDRLEWTTSIVTSKSADEHLLCIQVTCESLGTASRLPSARKPYFIRQALSKLSGGMDGQIPVVDKPIYLKEDEVTVAKSLLTGEASNRLPIIYVSAADHDRHNVDIKALTHLVSGTAHVVVEPSKTFSAALRRLVDSRNVHGGSVGVYWPESNARRVYFPDRGTKASIEIEIAKDVRFALANRRQKTNCTWLYLKELIAKSHYERLKNEGSAGVDDFIAAFDEDLRAKEERISEAESEIARLNSEIRRLNASTTSSDSGILCSGKEQNLYQDEIKSFVLSALDDGLRNSPPDSRREHIFKDLIEHNSASKRREELQLEIKSVLRNYDEMSQKVKSTLTSIGFTISQDGKHHKAIFQGDNRYGFTISKTSSDSRAGKNLVSDINNKLF